MSLKKLGIVSLMALTLVGFSACGGGSSTATEGPKSLVGTWSVCKLDGDGSRKKVLTFNSDKSGAYKKYIYTNKTCEGEGDLSKNETFTYKSGKTFKAGDSDATELDVAIEDGEFYTSYKLTGNTFIMADDDDNANCGENTDNRCKNFNENSEVFTKE